MPQRRLLYLDANQLQAFLWQGGALAEEGRFPQTDDGVEAFSEYLSKHRGSIFALLADLADEGFQIESLPYTQGADRQALLSRKLGQYFYGSPLATALSFGRDKGGRRDEKFLFTALTRPQQVEPWLAALRAVEAPLAGVYSLPLLGGALLAKLPNAADNCLLVCVCHGGIRQSFFENGQLKFSRLTQMAASDPAEIAAGCAAEALKIKQYLLGQRLLARGTALTVHVLVHPAHNGAFIDHCRSNDELQIVLQDLHGLSKSIGLKTLPRDSYAETLYLQLLAAKPPSDQLAQPAERRFYRLWQTRFALNASGLVILGACLLYAGKQGFESLQLHERAAQTQAQADSDAQKYQAILKTFPPMPTGTEALREVINRFEALSKRSEPPLNLYLAISRALEQVPRVDIERLQWQLGASPEGSFQLPQDARKSAAAPSDKAGGMYANAAVHGLLPAALAADQRGQLDTVNAFADALRKTPGLEVSVLRMPFDIESGKSLKSSAAAETAATQPKFILLVSRKL